MCQNFEFVDFIELQIFEFVGSEEMMLVEKERFHFSFSDKFANTDNIQEIKRKGLNTIQKEI